MYKRQALSWRPLAYVGRISYGLYLWHGVLIWYQLPWPIAVPLSIAIATASYYVIERPFLRLKDRIGRAAPSEPVATIPGLTPVLTPGATPSLAPGAATALSPEPAVASA